MDNNNYDFKYFRACVLMKLRQITCLDLASNNSHSQSFSHAHKLSHAPTAGEQTCAIDVQRHFTAHLTIGRTIFIEIV